MKDEVAPKRGRAITDNTVINYDIFKSPRAFASVITKKERHTTGGYASYLN